jgi:histidyl-tRNA synthetase
VWTAARWRNGPRTAHLPAIFLLPDARNAKVPCVGVSLGVERLFSIIEAQAAEGRINVRPIDTEVQVVSGQGVVEERVKICSDLWDAGIKAEVRS